MRTREEIRKEIAGSTQLGISGDISMKYLIPIAIEVLLDVRDLLLEINKKK